MTKKYAVTLVAQKVIHVEAENEEQAEELAEKQGNGIDEEVFFHVEDCEEWESPA
jgi:hypothetical protein